MIKLSMIPVLLMLATPALAGAPQQAKSDQTTRHGGYWLSHDLNRLVFWQPPSSETSQRR